jgi:hypothetical protein
MYKDMFANPMYKPLWFKAFGLSCYTRLVGALCCTMPHAKPQCQKPSGAQRSQPAALHICAISGVPGQRV